MLVCFFTFGSYMKYAPFIEDSDDQLSQLAQLQIFLTLLSSLSLRALPPSEFVSSLVTVVLFAVPLLGLALETPLLDVLGEAKAKLGALIAQAFPNLKPPNGFDPPLAEPNKTPLFHERSTSPPSVAVVSPPAVKPRGSPALNEGLSA